MSLTPAEFHDFTRFAETKLSSGASESLEQLVNEWNSQREYDQSVARIRQSMADYEAGRVMSLEEAFDRVRARLEIRE